MSNGHFTSNSVTRQLQILESNYKLTSSQYLKKWPYTTVRAVRPL